MDVEDDASVKKKIDKLDQAVHEKVEVKKCEKSESEDPKPRIVLTFRSEKSNTKTANMKIVSSEEKHEEMSPRRSGRTRGKWDWVCDSDNSISPKKEKSQSASDNDNESDNSHTPQKRTRRRSKDGNIVANAIARKEKYYNEATPSPTQRLSRRIKPTAKILANEELRIGLESQNNARLGIQSDKSPEDGVRTRRSARPANNDEKAKTVNKDPCDVVEIDTDSQNSDMKLQHLCNLGLKAIDPEEAEDSEAKDLDDNEADMLEEDEEEIDDDSEVISKLLEADDDSGSDDDYLCSLDANKKRDGRPRRSTRLYSVYGNNDSDESSAIVDEEASSSSKTRARRSSRRAAPYDDGERTHRSRRKKRVSVAEEEEMEQEEDSFPATAGDEGSEAACPPEQSTVVATCFCESASNVYASLDETTEPIFCQSIEMVDGVRVGCSHAARRHEDGGPAALLRAGPRAPYFLACTLHYMQLVNHMCCPACGLFCTQGIFYQCSEGHLFHLDCGIPRLESKAKPGCPHCGVYSYKWLPVNSNVAKVRLEMKCSNKRIFLPDQREQCTPAYLGFTSAPVDSPPAPFIPEDLLPQGIELKSPCTKPGAVKTSPQALAEAIIAGESLEQLIPKIVSGPNLSKSMKAHGGGTCLHVAAKCGHLSAVYLLHNGKANLNATDANSRTALMAAVMALLDKPDAKINDEKSDKDEMDVDVKQDEESVKDEKEQDDNTDTGPKDEDLLRVIKYLIAAGCDVNLADQPESMTPLHIAAQHGSVDVTSAILDAPDVLVDARDQGGWTPLVWAAENGHDRVVRLLLSAGADATSTDTDGNSAVHWCVLAGSSAVLRTLLTAEPALELTNTHGDTPLHIAARQGHYSCVVILLARGARSDVENAAGELPASVATGPCQAAISLNMQMCAAIKDNVAPFRMLSSDISNGRESLPIPCINEVDTEPLPTDFTYVTAHVTPSPLHLDTSLQTLQGCTCTGPCAGAGCACSVLSVRDWWRAGRLLPSFPYHDPPMLFHCGPTCACNMKQCGNNVISRLVRTGAVWTRSEVYRAGGARGWGLRAAAHVPRGSPVAEYTGELLPLQQADARPDDSYMFALDVKRDLLEQCTDKTVLCVDARRYGSAARFINHSCAPSLVPVRVFDVARDLRLPRVVLVAVRDVAAGEPFTFDYGDKFWAVKSKWMKCECGSPDCRYPTKAEETETQT